MSRAEYEGWITWGNTSQRDTVSRVKLAEGRVSVKWVWSDPPPRTCTNLIRIHIHQVLDVQKPPPLLREYNLFSVVQKWPDTPRGIIKDLFPVNWRKNCFGSIKYSPLILREITWDYMRNQLFFFVPCKSSLRLHYESINITPVKTLDKSHSNCYSKCF